jgi:YesN/AraC family two-component response regulator
LSARAAGEALRILDDSPVDVLLSDIEMPGVDGYGLIRELRARPPDAAAAPPPSR